MATLALALLLGQGNYTLEKLPNPGQAEPRLLMRIAGDRQNPSKKSPQKFGLEKMQWEFDWVVGGFSTNSIRGAVDQERHRLKFNVFSQERKQKDDVAPQVTRMLLRLWGHNFDNLRLDHVDNYGYGAVDVYLCWGGRAGGEQRFDVEFGPSGPGRPVNTIYIYDLASFKDPIEKAREVAHEYGHASLPAVGGFKVPEDWGNGFLGEKMFLLWARTQLEAKLLAPEDLMGARLPQVDSWVKINVEPLVRKGLSEGPNLVKKAKVTMDDYLALSLAMYASAPGPVYSRGTQLAGSAEAKDIPGGMALAAEEPEAVIFAIPAYTGLKTVWIPTGSGTVKVGKVVKAAGGWAQVQAVDGKVIVVNKH